MILIAIIILLLSIALLVKSSDYFVEYASRVAQRLGISELIIGLTIVALGTSFPELVSSVYASYLKNSGLVMGNILGSNFANIALILGVGSTLMVLKISKKTLYRDGTMMLFASVLLGIFIYTNNQITKIEGIILLILFILYNLWILNISPKKHLSFIKHIALFFKISTYKNIYKKVTTKRKTQKQKFKESLTADILIIILAAVGIFIGARYTVIQAIAIAKALNISELIIAFTIVALGTSLPELSVTISSARKGLGGIMVGNVIGSNIANILLVGGAAAIINPLTATLSITFVAMMGITVLLLLIMRTKWKIQKYEGIVFLIIYFSFMAWTVYKNLLIS